MDNLWEEVAYWQQHDEDRNLEIIFEHELQTVQPEELGAWFRNELNRRKIND